MTTKKNTRTKTCFIRSTSLRLHNTNGGRVIKRHALLPKSESALEALSPLFFCGMEGFGLQMTFSIQSINWGYSNRDNGVFCCSFFLIWRCKFHFYYVKQCLWTVLSRINRHFATFKNNFRDKNLFFHAICGFFTRPNLFYRRFLFKFVLKIGPKRALTSPFSPILNVS